MNLGICSGRWPRIAGQRFSTWLLAASGVVVAAGCDSANPAGTPTDAGHDKAVTDADGPTVAGGGVTLSVKPRHLTTASTEPYVTVQAVSQIGNVDATWALAGIELHSDSTGAVVPAHITSQELPLGGFLFFLPPNSPLTEGWYSVVIRPPASNYHFSGGEPEGPADSITRADGTLETHFRVGSSPTLLAVAACASYDESLLPKLILSMSEA
jgi:hypothetical protein